MVGLPFFGPNWLKNKTWYFIQKQQQSLLTKIKQQINNGKKRLREQ